MSVPYQRAARHRAAATFFAFVLCLSLPVSALAAPTNAKIRAEQAKADKARDELEDLQADLEERTEDYLAVEAELELTGQRISATEKELAAAQSELERSKSQLNGRADAIYRTGNVDMLAVVVGATDFRDLVTRLDLMRRIGRSDATIVAAVKDAKARIESAMTTLERRRAEQLVLRDEARVKKQAVEKSIAAQSAYLDRLDSNIKKLIAEEKKRQKELARRAAAAAAAAAAAGRGSGPDGRVFDEDALASASSHPEAVTWARKYVNRTWYLWGGTTPAGFDCSGLVQYCYRQIGIDIPRTSRTQYFVGAYIPRRRLDLLEPGDLVFFGRDGDPGRIHHVAMYIGGGDMIEAPYTGARVCVSSLTSRIARRGDYVGGARP